MKRFVSVPFTTYVYIEAEGNDETEVLQDAVTKASRLETDEYRKLWEQEVEYMLHYPNAKPEVYPEDTKIGGQN